MPAILLILLIAGTCNLWEWPLKALKTYLSFVFARRTTSWSETYANSSDNMLIHMRGYCYESGCVIISSVEQYHICPNSAMIDFFWITEFIALPSVIRAFLHKRLSVSKFSRDLSMYPLLSLTSRPIYQYIKKRKRLITLWKKNWNISSAIYKESVIHKCVLHIGMCTIKFLKSVFRLPERQR